MNATIQIQQSTAAPLEAECLDALLQRAITDSSATMQSGLVVLGERLGLYRALAEGGELLPAELAQRSGTAERYVQEWLNANAASRYVTYLPATGRYCMTAEQAAVFAYEESPAYMLGGFEIALAAVRIIDRLESAFRTGEGVSWAEHHHGVFHGCERFYRGGYLTHLVQDWIPAIDGLRERLEQGATVADLGCGHGAPLIILAQAFPNSRFVGFDSHPVSIAIANERVRRSGLGDRVRFEVAPGADFPGRDYDLVTMFDALHDTGDPSAVAEKVRSVLKPDGTWMIVEPRAADRTEDNFHAVGRAYYAGSTLMCTPGALHQGPLALGAQAGEARLRAVVMSAGFGKWRRAAETPVNSVFEARP